MKTLAACMCAACLASACADVGDARYPQRDGWRVGIVESVAPAGSAPGNGCGEAAALDHAVYVRYYAGMRPRRTVVAIVPGTDWPAGQRLYFNLRDCRRQGIPIPDAGRRIQLVSGESAQ